MLYQAEVSGDSIESVITALFDGSLQDADELALGGGARRFAERIVRGVSRRREELDALIRAGSEHWRLERMAAVDRNVLRIALFEILDDPDTPAAVILDEAIEIAKLYGGPESGRFVNGVADGIRRRLESGEFRRQ